MAAGSSPRTAGIEPVRVLAAWKDPRPPDPDGKTRPVLHPTRKPADKLLRSLQALTVERAAAILASDPGAANEQLLCDALAGYRRLHAQSLALEVPPDPGYLVSFLPFVDTSLRERLRTIFDEYFAPADEQEFVRMASRARSLTRWIADPLRPAR